MTLQSTDYASLSQDAYTDPVLGKKIPIGGLEYKAIAFEDDPKTGFQATAYEHINANGSHDVVIAYRGTEFKREPRQDGLTDAGMALAGVNAQTAKSEAFTQRVLTLAEDRAKKDHNSLLNVTVTGHSLGGTLAEINAYKFGLHGETFNAYGAAGLLQGIPAGGHQVIDNVKATDVVSAASPHFGEVRIYATQQDIDAIAKGGYTNSRFLNALPEHEPILGKVQLEAHYITNFVPDPKTHTTILAAEDAQRAQANAVMIASYRSNIDHARAVVALPGESVTRGVQAVSWGIEAEIRIGEAAVHEIDRAALAVEAAGARVGKAAAHDAGVVAHTVEHAGIKVGEATLHGTEAAVHTLHQTIDDTWEKEVQVFRGASQAIHAVGDAVGHEAAQIHDRLSRPAMPSHQAALPDRMDHPSHPDHALFRQVQNGVHLLDAQHGRVPDHLSDKLAASLTVAAKERGLKQVDQVALGDDASRTFAAQHAGTPVTMVAHVETAQAVNTSVEQSTQRLVHINQELAQTQARQQIPALVQNPPQPSQQTGSPATR